MSHRFARSGQQQQQQQHSLSAHASQLSQAVIQHDGATTARLFSLRNHTHVQGLYSSLPDSAKLPSDNKEPFLAEYKRLLSSAEFQYAGTSPWSTMASRHAAAIIYISNTELDQDSRNEVSNPSWQEAYAAQLELVKIFVAWFSDSTYGNTAWALPVLFCVCNDLKTLAIKADQQLRRMREKATRLEEASRIITKGWTACLNDRSPAAAPGAPRRSLGTYYMATLLFKIYFKLETLGLCKNVVRGIQNQIDLPALSSFPMSHQVTYRYFLGIFAFLNEKYTEAESELDFAFRHCHRRAYRNQERILSYLIPLRLAHGVLPSDRLLASFPRLSDLYTPLVNAYRQGNLKAYDDALLAKRGELVQRGTFLIVERAREGCLRTLFKKVWLCSGRGSRLSTVVVQQALAHVEVVIDLDEVECLLANLIFKGHLKGYISHERQTVVLAKEKPFPDLIGKTL